MPYKKAIISNKKDAIYDIMTDFGKEERTINKFNLEFIVMKTIKNMTLIILMILTSSAALAHHRHCRHINHYAYYQPTMTRIVVRPVTSTHISIRLSKYDRLDMALAYLKNNKSLSIAQYSKMTRLPKTTAEAELDGFAANKHNPIKMVINGKKKFYVI